MDTEAVFTVREEFRYEVAGNQPISITLNPDQQRSQPTTMSGQLLNLSSHGARLAVAEELPPDTTLRLKMSIEQLAVDLYVAARVCWVSGATEHTSIVGCQLSPSIPDGLLKHLADGGRLDRRDLPRRYDLRKLRIGKGPLPAKASEPGMLQNYAPGGFCIETARSWTLEEQVHVFIGPLEDGAILAVPRWQLKQGNRFLLGCQYAEENGFERLELAIAETVG